MKSERQPFHKRINPLCTVSLLGCLSVFLILPAFAFTPSNILIQNPGQNAIVSSGFNVFGKYTSPDAKVSIMISIDNVNSTIGATGGLYAFTTAIADGTHNMAVYLYDSNGVTTATVQFNQISTHVTSLKYPIIVPMYSQTCSTLIKSGDYSECPPLSELMQYDTSNQAISGHFVLQKNGQYIRQPPESKNHYQFYTNTTNPTVCVECEVDLGSGDTAQQIFIEPHGFTYVKHSYTNDVINNTINNVGANDTYYTTLQNVALASHQVFYDRYVDDTCVTANISYSPFLMQDTINYLKSGCTITNFNGTKEIPQKNTTFSFDNPYSTLHYKKQVDRIKATGGFGNCIDNQCHFKDPYRKIGY